ncbi:LamG domain-containing protein [Flagellimonas sp. CMM7]|uniref:LamG domain-containing protein n=1 Tax=Flagellimonas sp. CMM7 TaxID=2654676 RepID=UPI0013D259C7|nr:LamG domain-containing protein [Flagellimonas sp. CMM7]UII79860.1 LamG domain-containing protein [Flagellimonas sp. CMM7]
MKFINKVYLLLVIGLLTVQLHGQTNKSLLAYWDFNEVTNNTIKDKGGNISDEITGYYKLVEGVNGKAIKCDGFTTSIQRDEETSPVIIGPFTIEAWVAPQAYPWNWCAIYNQEYKKHRGMFFGIDGEGRVGLHAAVARQWRECISTETIPYMKWSYIAATYHPETGMKVYINGKLSGELPVKGDLLYDREFPMQIARNHKSMAPSSLNRAGFVDVPAKYSFDGLIDELKITGKAKSQGELERIYEQLKPQNEPQLIWRKLPEIHIENPEFGAHYTKLNYDEDWDRLWRDDSYPDVVITFDDKRYSMVFWKGTNYNMNLVTENGRWIADQSAETFGDFGCMEHMSDKQNRYSHIRVVENNEARVVVHWRYALTDINYSIANTDEVTNWGDWADEYYYIYPDGIAVRHYKIHGYDDGYSITEPALLSNPGERPEDNIDMVAVTLMNLKGETSKHSFETWPSDQLAGAGGQFKNAVDNEVLSVINVKSQTKPFFIYEKNGNIGPYGGGRKEIDYRLSKFHWRNHWPVSQIPSDGRFVLANDRVTSSAITSPEAGINRETENGPLEGRFILGLSGEPIQNLTGFAKFWLKTPELKVTAGNYTHQGFNRNDRAYHLIKNSDANESLTLDIQASEKSPLVNPTFIIKNWGGKVPVLEIDGLQQSPSKKYKYSIRKSLESKDLIIWLETDVVKPVTLTLN